MKKILYSVPLICLLLSVAGSINAQTAADTARKENKLVIPPLADILDSALKYSPFLQYRKLEIEAKHANLQMEKNYWTRNLGFQADTRYGTFDNFSSTNNGLSTTVFNATSKQLNYGLGLYMKFPIGDLLNRKSQIKKANTELEQARSMAQAQEEELRQTIIKLYQDVLLKQRLLNIQSLALGNAKVNMDMVDKEFRNGVIPVSEYVRISDITTKVEADYEKAKTDFTTARMILEELAGFPFNPVSK